jgi:hypothetical protein
MAPAGLEPAIPASERPQTHALDRAATGIGIIIIIIIDDDDDGDDDVVVVTDPFSPVLLLNQRRSPGQGSIFTLQYFPYYV